jgi:uncharacterized protein YlxP (DUF503 family)
MLVGLLQCSVHIHDAQSLKDKRRVVLAIKDRLHRDHQAAVAEVAHQETLNMARLGLAIVGSDGKYLAQMLDRLTDKIRAVASSHGEAELGETTRRIVHMDDLPDVSERSDASDTRTLADELTARAEEAFDDEDDARR